MADAGGPDHASQDVAIRSVHESRPILHRAHGWRDARVSEPVSTGTRAVDAGGRNRHGSPRQAGPPVARARVTTGASSQRPRRARVPGGHRGRLRRQRAPGRARGNAFGERDVLRRRLSQDRHLGRTDRRADDGQDDRSGRVHGRPACHPAGSRVRPVILQRLLEVRKVSADGLLRSGAGFARQRSIELSARRPLDRCAVRVALSDHWRVGLTAGYVSTDTGPGRRPRVPSATDQFTPQEAPGIGLGTIDFVRGGGFLVRDTRSTPSGTRRGGVYGVRWRKYSDRTHDVFDFSADRGRAPAVRAVLQRDARGGNPRGDDACRFRTTVSWCRCTSCPRSAGTTT